MTWRVYPNWVDEHGLYWSVDDGDHRNQIRVRGFRLIGVSGRDGIDEAWTRDELRDKDAPKMWVAVDRAMMAVVDGIAELRGWP